MKNWLLKNRFSYTSPEALAKEILDQAQRLVAKLDKEISKDVPLPQERYQDALISFSQAILLALIKACQETRAELENELFLVLARLTLKELLGREPNEAEFEYFLTYYRSHFELLRREMANQNEPFESELTETEFEKYFDTLLRRFLAQEREISH